jgi:hypothetical protein
MAHREDHGRPTPAPRIEVFGDCGPTLLSRLLVEDRLEAIRSAGAGERLAAAARDPALPADADKRPAPMGAAPRLLGHLAALIRGAA